MIGDRRQLLVAERAEKQKELFARDVYKRQGVPVTGENFLTMMGAWDAGEQECGEFVGLKDGYTMETTNEGALLTVEGDFAERDGALEFAFDKKGNIESLTIGAHYSTAEILKKAGLNTILGMGTVFVVLLSLIHIYLAIWELEWYMLL